jgi:FMN phosphatase YigB (HAD superfamily)
MFYAFILLSLLSFSAQAMEEPIVMLWAPYEVFLEPSINNSPLSKFIPASYGPKKFQNDLIAWIKENTSCPDFVSHPGSVPPLMQKWLLNKTTCQEMKEIVQRKTWFINPVYHVAGAAFDPQTTADHLVPIEKVLALIMACQQQGHQTCLASNWNTESFAAIKTTHSCINDLFDKQYISGEEDSLTSDLAFYEAIKNTMGGGRSYYYIDTEEGQESLDAAREAGVTPISVIAANNKEKADDLKSKLERHGLLPQQELLQSNPSLLK